MSKNADRFMPAIWLVAFIFLSLYRSQDFLAVDGVLRCLEVYHHQPEGIFFHGNNHLFYPSNVFLWHKLLGLFGVYAADPIAYVKATQLMNAFFAAGCVAIVYWLVLKATSSFKVALGAAFCLMFTRAFLLHATNSAEPMVGLFWSLLAVQIAVVSLQRKKFILAFMAGLVLALALATYQSMVFFGPVIALLIWTKGDKIQPHYKEALQPVLLFILGGFVGVCLFFGAAYSYSGIDGIAPKIKQFVSVPAGNVYGGLEPRKVMNTPVGLVGNVIPALPPDYSGLRSLWREHRFDIWMLSFVLSMSIIFSFLSLLIYCGWKKRHEITGRKRTISLILITSVLTTLFCPLYWEPTYDKLWLQPIVGVIILCAALIAYINSKKISAVSIVLLILIVVSNSSWLIPSSTQQIPYLQEARQVAHLLKAEDLLVADWDGVSVIYGTIYQGDSRTYGFITKAHDLRERTRDDLENEIYETTKRGGQVYFLGILDQSPQAWEAFLGAKVGVPYASLDMYRQEAKVVERFQLSRGEVTLRVLPRS